MPGICRIGDTGTGHGCFPPRPCTSGSGSVFANGIGIHRQGDSWAVHTCDTQSHAGTLAAGSSSVYVNGKACGRIGDPVSCGSAVATGSGTVFAG